MRQLISADTHRLCVGLWWQRPARGGSGGCTCASSGSMPLARRHRATSLYSHSRIGENGHGSGHAHADNPFFSTPNRQTAIRGFDPGSGSARRPEAADRPDALLDPDRGKLPPPPAAAPQCLDLRTRSAAPGGEVLRLGADHTSVIEWLEALPGLAPVAASEDHCMLEPIETPPGDRASRHGRHTHRRARPVLRRGGARDGVGRPWMGTAVHDQRQAMHRHTHAGASPKAARSQN
jgi:hypothetical protein